MSDNVFLPTSPDGNLPPEVFRAIQRFRAQAPLPGDRQILIDYLASGQADYNTANAIGTIIGSLGGGDTSTQTPTLPGGTSSQFPTMGGGPGTDWAVEAQNQGLATPPITGGSDGLQLPFGMSGLSDADLGNYGRPSPDPLASRSPQFVSPSGGLTLPGARPDTGAPAVGRPLTGPGGHAGPEDWRQYDPTHFGAPQDTSGVLSPAGSPLDARAEHFRQQQIRRGGGGGGGGRGQEDWAQAALQFGQDPNSPFYGMNTAASDLYATDPQALATLLYGQGGGAADFMAPQLQAALGLSQIGALSGHGGIGTGPSSTAGNVTQAQQFIGQLGQGQFIDPQWVSKRALRSLANTPEQLFVSEGGQGGASDWESQISTTKAALLGTAGNFMNQESAAALSARIDMAAQDWLQAMATAPDLTTMPTFPQYLKSIGARHWVGSGI
jgi:hypothetical protein